MISASIRQSQINTVEGLLNQTIQGKLSSYARETSYIPFLSRIIQNNELLASYSFIHSIATTLGMSIYEQIAQELLLKRGLPQQNVQRKYKMRGEISEGQRALIGKIVSDLINGISISWSEQVRQVLAARSQGRLQTPKKPSIVDLFYREGEEEFYIDIKTVKPNVGDFKEYKGKLLEWIARKNMAVRTVIAFPYNPYYPELYDRFTVKGLLIPGEEMLIGEEFWSLLAGWNIYNDLLEVFDKVGKSWQDKVKGKIRKVASESFQL